MSNEGKNVKVHYVGTLDDGSKFDSSRDRGEPLAFTCMAGQMIPGFDEAVKNMAVGETITVTIPAAQAYGEPDPKMIIRMQFDALPGSEKLEVGQHPVLATPDGRPLPCVVVAKDEETITFDMNHELAGKDLTFEIELLEAE
ncbi:MAG: peptidylprolyl isomerase [Eggerthellaceae bacterium]|nr:peptidylprolyl isomerase [Eggerthellaceae bacterium]